MSSGRIRPLNALIHGYIHHRNAFILGARLSLELVRPHDWQVLRRAHPFLCAHLLAPPFSGVSPWDVHVYGTGTSVGHTCPLDVDVLVGYIRPQNVGLNFTSKMLDLC